MNNIEKNDMFFCLLGKQAVARYEMLERDLAISRDAYNHITASRSWKLCMMVWQLKNRCKGFIKRLPFFPLLAKTRAWLKKCDRSGKSELEPYSEFFPEKVVYQPKISIVMPVYNVKAKYLRQAIDSVLDQFYTNWELCIADDCSTDTHIRPILEEYSKKDPRIKVRFSTINRRIAGASNYAMEQATGEFIAYLDNDDMLTPDAVSECVKRLNEKPDADILYSDNYVINENGQLQQRMIKPDWSPERFLSTNYLVHFCVYRAALLFEAGGLNEAAEFDVTQDIEIKARLIAHTEKIEHINKCLYCWRVSPTSVASSIYAKDRMVANSISALSKCAAYYKNNTLDIYMPKDAQQLGVGYFAVKFKKIENPVTLVVHVFASSMLNQRLSAKLQQLKNKYFAEVIVACDHFDKEIHITGITVAPAFGSQLDYAVKAANSRYVVLATGHANNISWSNISNLIGYLDLSEDIGAVGGKTCSADGRIQSGAYLLMNNLQVMHGGVWKNACIEEAYAQNVSAVSWDFMALRTSAFLQFYSASKQQFPELGDVDICLQLRQAGKRIVYNPRVELEIDNYFFNSTLLNWRLPEYRELHNKFAAVWGYDPYYSQAFSQKRQYELKQTRKEVLV